MKNSRFLIYYNSEKPTEDYCVDEFGWYDTIGNPSYSFSEKRTNYIIHIITKGQCHLTVWEDDKEFNYTLTSGQAFIIRPGIRHKYVSESADPYYRYWLSLSGRTVESLLCSCGIGPNVYVIENLDVKEVEKLFGKFYQALQRERAPVYDFLALSYLMLGMFKRVVSNVQNTVPKTQKQIMLDAVSQYVENNLDQNLSIADIANRFGYERSWLYRTFLNEKGFSLQQYMIMTKIKKARYLVAETEMSYEQIAHTLGYNSYSAFSKVFKKIVGTSPSEYRCNSREYKRGKVVKDSKTGKGSKSKKTVK